MEEILEKGAAAPDVSFRQGREQIHLKDFFGKTYLIFCFLQCLSQKFGRKLSF